MYARRVWQMRPLMLEALVIPTQCTSAIPSSPSYNILLLTSSWEKGSEAPHLRHCDGAMVVKCNTTQDAEEKNMR